MVHHSQQVLYCIGQRGESRSFETPGMIEMKFHYSWIHRTQAESERRPISFSHDIKDI